MIAPEGLRKKHYDHSAVRAARFADALSGSGVRALDDAVLAVALDLWSGLRVSEIAKTCSQKWGYVRAVATAIGWDEGWVVGQKRGPTSGTTSSTCGTMTVGEVLSRFDAGEALVAIGAAAGVTRERIRQVAERHGRQPRHEAAAARRAITSVARRAEAEAKRAYRKAATRAAYMERWAEAMTMWDHGVPVTQIARFYRMALSDLSWYMHSGRKRYGVFQLRCQDRSRPRTPGLLGALTVDAVVSRVRGGEDPRSVRDAADVSLWRIRHACEAAGVKWPHVPRGPRAALAAK